MGRQNDVEQCVMMTHLEEYEATRRGVNEERDAVGRQKGSGDD